LFFYSAFGYGIRSEVKLPGFCETLERTTQINIVRKVTAPARVEFYPKENITISSQPVGIRVAWPGLAVYQVEKGERITCSSAFLDNQKPYILQPFYGILPAVLLQQNNRFILHGSTVEINGHALTVVGRKRIGKSTLTASLLANGCKFISDDVTALAEEDHSEVQVLPGIPRLKLWPDALRALGGNPAEHPLVAPKIPKHVLYVNEKQFANKKVPLKTIVMLDYGQNVELREMSLAEKMRWLVAGQYFANHEQGFTAETRSHWFYTCSRLVRKVSVIKATFPRNIKKLSALTRLLIQISG